MRAWQLQKHKNTLFEETPKFQAIQCVTFEIPSPTHKRSFTNAPLDKVPSHAVSRYFSSPTIYKETTRRPNPFFPISTRYLASSPLPLPSHLYPLKHLFRARQSHRANALPNERQSAAAAAALIRSFPSIPPRDFFLTTNSSLISGAVRTHSGSDLRM